MEGVCGFKCFLTHSGVDEFPCVNRAEVEAALAELKVCPAFDFKLLTILINSVN